MEYHKWMFNDKEWKRFNNKVSWASLGYYTITFLSPSKASPEQERFFDFTLACMVQQDYGWH